MTDEPDTLARLVAYHDHIAVPPVAVADDVRRGRRRVRRNRGLLTAGVALVVAGVAVAAPLLDGAGLADRPQPVAPQPSEFLPAPSPTAITIPKGWTGPLRPGASLPIVTMEPGNRDQDEPDFWTDRADVGFAGIDILEVATGLPENASWSLLVRGAPPQASTLDPAQQVIEYGLVVDSDGDRVADCQIGINNDAPKAGDYRVWVTNLRTGVTDERVGPPYGKPIDFSHPDERGDGDGPEGNRVMNFFFLFGTVPCDRLSNLGQVIPAPPSANFYAWASVTEGGRVTAWDYAPDAAWLDPT